MEAERRGRLFGLAGDALQRSGRRSTPCARPPSRTGRARRGARPRLARARAERADTDQPVFSQVDVDGLASWVAMKSDRRRRGDAHAAAGTRRVDGPAGRGRVDGDPPRTCPKSRWSTAQDELTTAQAYRAVGEFIPRLAVLIDAVFRHHTVSARTYFEGVVRDTSASVVCGVGFADLTGFTALTQRLTATELSEPARRVRGRRQRRGARRRRPGGEVHRRRGDVGQFDARTARESSARPGGTPAAHGKRACRSAPASATAACWPSAATTSATAVNLAARLVGAAAPGQILASSDVRDELVDWAAIPQDPLVLKGFDAPVTAYDLHLSR